MKNRSDNKKRSDKKRRNTAERQQHKTVILHHDFSTRKGLLPRYTANIDKMMNSDSIFYQIFQNESTQL